jgi:hypothetical protein
MGIDIIVGSAIQKTTRKQLGTTRDSGAVEKAPCIRYNSILHE